MHKVAKIYIANGKCISTYFTFSSFGLWRASNCTGCERMLDVDCFIILAGFFYHFAFTHSGFFFLIFPMFLFFFCIPFFVFKRFSFVREIQFLHFTWFLLSFRFGFIFAVFSVAFLITFKFYVPALFYWSELIPFLPFFPTLQNSSTNQRWTRSELGLLWYFFLLLLHSFHSDFFLNDSNVP